MVCLQVIRVIHKHSMSLVSNLRMSSFSTEFWHSFLNLELTISVSLLLVSMQSIDILT